MKCLKHIRNSIVLLGGLMAICPSVAQISKDKINLTIEAALPSGRSNPAFRSYLNGLVNLQPKLQYRFGDHIVAAIGPKYSYYVVSEFKVPQKMKGGAHTVGGFLELGWTDWRTESLGIEFGVKTGLAQTIFITSLTRLSGIQRVNAMYVEPTFSLIVVSDEAVCYRWIIGYNITGYDFKPFHTGIGSDVSYTPEELNKPCQSLLVGFGFSYYFGNKRSDDEIMMME